jgi:CheY-like chemotaxis protein
VDVNLRLFDTSPPAALFSVTAQCASSFEQLRKDHMKILVAEDDAVTRKMLVVTLERLGWDVIQAEDGNAAWQAFETLKGKSAPELAVLDWMMPGVEGIEICRRLRTTPGFELVYVILVTSRGGKEDLSYGLAAGANDYITKPFDPVELQARVRVGERMVRLQRSLAARVTELEAALAHVQRLQGLLPICSYCKKVRNEANYWEQVESYLGAHSDLDFTHSICPQCTEKMMKEIAALDAAL